MVPTILTATASGETRIPAGYLSSAQLYVHILSHVDDLKSNAALRFRHAGENLKTADDLRAAL